MTNRMITVKGRGNVETKPDLIILSMSLEAREEDYADTVESAARDINTVRKALVTVGFDADCIKTTDFRVDTNYESYKDKSGNWKQKFVGYQCTHKLKLEFDFSMKLLNKTLSAIRKCSVTPVFNIAFSVKDSAAVSEQLLVNAVNNATQKAAVLASAANVKLGDIINIDYNWGELQLYSDTKLAEPLYCASDIATPLEIDPDDIKVNDTVTVTWSIE